MTAPLYITPAGRAVRHLRRATLIARWERVARVSLAPVLPPRAGAPR